MSIHTQTYDGVPDGSFLAMPPHEIPDTGARYIQDGLLDQEGLLYRRGPLGAPTGVLTFTDSASGLVHTVNPETGVHRIAVLEGTSAAKLSVLSEDYASKTQLTWHGTLPTSPYYIVDTKPAIGGGVLVGTSKRVDAVSPVQALGYWRGSDRANYTTGTVSVTRGSTSVTGSGTSWSSAAAPGMFLFATITDPTSTTAYIGVVESVASDTSLTLKDPAPYSASSTYTLQSVRGICPKYTSGRITTETTSTTVTGAATKFKDNSLDSGTWTLYRASDMTYVGKVSSVTNNTTLVLTANSAIAMENEHFVALKADGSYSLDTTADSRKVGFLNAVYAERQFYANSARSSDLGYRLWFSEPGDPEALDLSPNDGNFIEVTSTKVGATESPIVALAPAFNSLLILKEDETFALIGTTPTQFQLRKLTDDGTLSSMSVQQYEGGVIYAGRDGIYAYDGVQSANITQDRLGWYYKSLVKDFDPKTYRMWSMIVRDHYFLFIETVDPDYLPRKGNVVTNITRLTISIYLPTRAVSFMTNLDIRGAATLPAQTGKGTWFIVNTSSGARICRATDLFESDGPDAYTCTGNTIGPDFYMESKRYSIEDALRKKLFKQLQLHYYVGGADLSFDTITGLNEDGNTSASQWLQTLLAWDAVPTSAASTWDGLRTAYATWDDLGEPRYRVKRIKFLKRSQHFGFRLYQESASVTKVRLGPWAIGFKLQRPGRV